MKWERAFERGPSVDPSVLRAFASPTSLPHLPKVLGDYIDDTASSDEEPGCDPIQ